MEELSEESELDLADDDDDLDSDLKINFNEDAGDLESLDDVKDVDSAKSGGLSLVARFKFEMHGFLATDSEPVKPGKGYELIIREVQGEDRPELQGELGTKLMALDENNPWGYIGAGYAALSQEDGERAMALARAGLGKKPDMRELLLLQAEAHFSLGQFDDCMQRCKVFMESEEILDDDPWRMRVMGLNRRAAIGKDEAPDDEDPEGGDSTPEDDPGEADPNEPVTE
jgi:hypothetical protein